jgi:hypothetical protein
MSTSQEKAIMTRKDARNLIKGMYRGTTLLVLQELIARTYRGKENADDAQRKTTTGVRPIMLSAGRVSEKQFYNVLSELQAGGVLAYQRKAGKITYSLNLELLPELKTKIEKAEAEKQSRKRDHKTAKAREKKAKDRELAQTANQGRIGLLRCLAGCCPRLQPEAHPAVA